MINPLRKLIKPKLIAPQSRNVPYALLSGRLLMTIESKSDDNGALLIDAAITTINMGIKLVQTNIADVRMVDTDRLAIMTSYLILYVSLMIVHTGAARKAETLGVMDRTPIWLLVKWRFSKSKGI